MQRRIILVMTGVTLAVILATLTGCGCSITGGEGGKAVDVSMGGKVVKADYLSFKPVSLSGTALVIQNTASESELEIGAGTPILSGDGTEASHVLTPVTIPAGDQGTLHLSDPLAAGATYYLGEPQGGGKPTIRQLFICPENQSGGGGGYDIPNVDDVEIPE